MVKFSPIISDRWNVSKDVAETLIKHFEKGDSIYYISDYSPLIAAELDIFTLSDIFVFLGEIHDLSPKKKRLISTITKAGALDDALKRRIESCSSPTELDDILLAYRTNTRSKGQQAIEKGLGPLAERINNQEDEEGTLEEFAQPYVGKHETLQSVEDVIAGVKDILTERFASDETVRSMARDAGFEDGFFEVFPKNKKDKRFYAYRGKMVSGNELTSEEYLNLHEAEKNKDIRLKHGIQLFRISELLRHHCITNPDAVGYDCLCEVIDETWSKILQPIVERDVKERFYKKAEAWAIREIDKVLGGMLGKKKLAGTFFTVGNFNNKTLVLVAINEKGNLVGAAKEELSGSLEQKTSERIKQFAGRYKPGLIVVYNNEHADTAEAIAKRSLRGIADDIPFEKVQPGETSASLSKSQWMQDANAMLEDEMKEVYALGLAYLQPLSIISQTGVSCFSIHPLQKLIGSEPVEKLLKMRTTEQELHKGVPWAEAPDSVLKNIECATDEVLLNIRKLGAKKPFGAKNDLLNVENMTEQIFRNIAGYILVPNADNAVDRTLVHPDHYGWLNEISVELNASIDSLVNDPERVRGVVSENYAEKSYIDRKLPDQLRVAQKYAVSVKDGKFRRRVRLSELTEGTIVTGRVTNITKFGVFVDINAVCDGLIHISQLADGYVETADQVVKLNDSVDVRILGVDKKKRRVSLSMKKLGDKAPKIRPSAGQLTNLADHFKNR